MSTTDGITIDLEGGALDPGAVADAISYVQSLVASTAGGEDGQLTLTGLRGGSAHISMKIDRGSLAGVEEGIAQLRRGPVLPGGWTRPTLVAVLNLARISNRRGVESINLRVGETIAQIDSVIQENAEKALAPSSVTLGSVRGHLYRYTNDPARNRRSAGLRRAGTDDSIDLRFSQDGAAAVLEHLEADVEVWGEIARDFTGEIAHIVVEGIEHVVATDESTGAPSGRGLLGTEWTGGVDPAVWVRRMRD